MCLVNVCACARVRLYTYSTRHSIFNPTNSQVSHDFFGMLAHDTLPDTPADTLADTLPDTLADTRCDTLPDTLPPNAIPTTNGSAYRGSPESTRTPFRTVTSEPTATNADLGSAASTGAKPSP